MPPILCLAETVTTPTERLVDTNGVTLKVIEAGERGNPVVVLAHGFPELAYSWRHQIPVLAAAGYHVLAPDQRGYGGSSRPEDIDAYNIVELTADIAGLLDDIGAEKAVLIGHDWGSPVATNFPLFYPDRVRAVVAMSVPPVPRAPTPDADLAQDRRGQLLLHPVLPGTRCRRRPHWAPTRVESMRRVLSMEGFSAPRKACRDDRYRPLPDWITADEFEHYVQAYTENGFTGPLNWYRNFDRNWELTENTSAKTITVPTLFLTSTADPVLGFTPRDQVHEVVTGDYREVLLDGAGHAGCSRNSPTR